MKKILMTLAVLALASGTALAQQGDGSGMKRGGGPDGDRGMRDANREKRGDPVSDEMRAQMRAERDAIRDILGAIRLETDDARKAELTGQLRTRLGTIADRMQEHQEARLAQAEERFNALKERIEQAKANRDTLIEEEVQRLLSGERPGRPATFDEFPYAKGGMRGPGKGDDRPGRGPHGRMPPPPSEEAFDDMPPPSEE